MQIKSSALLEQTPCCPHGSQAQASVEYEDFCVRSRYQGQGQVITSHSIRGINFLSIPLTLASGTQVLIKIIVIETGTMSWKPKHVSSSF